MSAEETQSALDRAAEALRAGTEVATETGTDVVRAAGTDIAAERKVEMVRKRAEIMRREQEARKAYDEAKAVVQQEKDRLQKMLWALEKEFEPMRKKLALMADGIDALNIYLGRDEEIIVVREGERAPESEPVTVRQLVLVMGEESLLAVDGDGMDYRDIDDFTDWLTRSEEHIQQIIPEQKSVVALIPRRAKKEYASPWEQDAADAENRRTWWLIRNGECLWLTTTAFTVGERVVPTPKEFTSLFERRTFDGKTEPLQPGTREWEKAEESADARTRHYMKVALLLEGLIERTTVFHPHMGASFLNQSDYDEGRIRVILDAEASLTSGRPSFSAWRKAKMSELQEGMRIIGAFRQRMRLHRTKENRPDVHPEGATPRNNIPYIVKARDSHDRPWSFSFERQDLIWDENTYTERAPKTKGTGYLDIWDDWVVPLDLVTEEEIAYYLNSRTERHAYLDMVPTLRAALAVKVAEREEEAPFRAALIGRLEAAGDTDAESIADDLIVWYKTANKWHRALKSEDESAAKLILAEARRRRSSAVSDDIIASIRAAHPNAIAIARRASDIVAVERTERVFGGVPTNVYVTVHVYGLRGALKDSLEWSMLRRSQIARWSILWESEAWSDQVFDAKARENLTDEQIDELVEFCQRHFPRLAQVRVDGEKAHAYAMNDDGEMIHAWVTPWNGARFHPSTSGLWGGARDLESSYWGEAKPETTVWQNDAVIADHKKAKAAAESERQENRRITDLVWRAVASIEDAWKVEETERIRGRFLEDFGDESLWEGHLKTVTIPSYPGESARDARSFGSWHHHPKPIAAAVRAIIERGESFAGKTVREVVTAEGGDIEKVHESIRDLAFPKEESE